MRRATVISVNVRGSISPMVAAVAMIARVAIITAPTLARWTSLRRGSVHTLPFRILREANGYIALVSKFILTYPFC